MGTDNSNGSIGDALSAYSGSEGVEKTQAELSPADNRRGSLEELTAEEKAIEVTASRIVIAMNLKTPKGEKRADEMRMDAMGAGLDPEKLALAIGDQIAIEAIARQIAEVLVSPADEGKIKAKELLDTAREEGRDTDKIKKAIKRLRGKK